MSDANDRQVGGDHYAGSIQHWDYVVANDLDYFQGQITKYVTRWKKKGGLQDLLKARHFLDKYIEVEQARAGSGPPPGVTGAAPPSGVSYTGPKGRPAPGDLSPHPTHTWSNEIRPSCTRCRCNRFAAGITCYSAEAVAQCPEGNKKEA